MGILDFFRPQPPLATLMRPPAPRPATSRVAVSYEGALASQLARTVGSWVPPRRGSAELLRAFAELPWLHAVVKRRAEALAQVEWVLYRAKSARARALRRSRIPGGPQAREAINAKTRATSELIKAGELELVLDHPFLSLLERPWPGGSETAFWRLSSQHQDLLGETLWAVERNAKGEPIELLPIVPTWVREIPAPGRPWFGIVTPAGTPIRLSVTDAVWIRQLDPLDPFGGRGIGTAAALNDELETDEYMAMTAKSRFFNRAIPEVMVGFLGQQPNVPPPSPAELQVVADAIEEKHRGSERAGKLHLFSGDFKAQALGTTMVENQHVQGREFLRNTFMQVFGTPPEVLGVLDNANRSTIDAAAYHFAAYSTVPVLELHRSALQEQLLPEYGDDLVADYISPIPSDREFEKGVMVALPAVFKWNEVRALGNKPPDPAHKNDYYPATTGNVPTPGEKVTAPDAKQEQKEEVEDDDDA